MKPAFELAEVRRLLRRGVDAGHWTLQDLDNPSPGWLITMEDAKRIAGFTPPTYRNLLRDEPTPTERVEIVSPRDFAVVETVADPVQRGSAPLLPRTDGYMAESFSDAGVQGQEGCVGDEADYGDEAHLGAAWKGSAFGIGDVFDDW
jgi:hypothetical protein